MTHKELIEKRVKLIKDARSFLESRRTDKGVLTAEDDKTYSRMEEEIEALGKEIERQKRQEKREKELNALSSTPILEKPESYKERNKRHRATDEYSASFWAAMRSKYPRVEVLNALEVGTDTEGGYLVPDEFERTLIKALEDENIFRGMAKIIHTSSGERKIPLVSGRGEAKWIDEEGAFTESDDTFGQITLSSYKLGTLIKVSEELINDSVFDLGSYIATEFGRRIGSKEEESFFTGDGNGKPTGILNATGGADVGVTATATATLTSDEIIDLYYSLRSPYRKNAVWVLADSTIKAIRKLKDSTGQYLWQPSLLAGTPDTLLGRPVKTSVSMPDVAAGAKAIAFGDFSYYWIAEREGRTFRRLGELYAPNGQVGFIASERLDGKLILSEAIKVLKMKSGS